MPIYEYECPECGNSAELIYISEKEANNGFVKCGKCGKKMKRVVSLSTFILKGGGWADDGYNKKE